MAANASSTNWTPVDELVWAVLFSDDFSRWKVLPKPGWEVTQDAEGNCTAHATEPFDPPDGWTWFATIYIVHQDGGLSMSWFPTGDRIPTQAEEHTVQGIIEEIAQHIEREAV